MAAQDTQIESENKDSKEPKNLFAHFTNLLFSAPIFNNKQERNKSEGEEREAAEASKKREMVKFSDPKPIAPPPMKLEVEDSEQNPAARYLQPKKAEETVFSKGTAKTSTVSEADDGNARSVKPSLARFPDATRPILPPPIELEAEEPAWRTSNPIVLWQKMWGPFVLRDCEIL
ncbi:hypothetical protein CICLE_v10009691mg [Citrus x clementina]|uniref:Uncharacterized protein n=1 Tax=Citrus clementina TaxID=85681 RepID=V4UGY3_CITCL|nr:hypothetical protein CICLE_v10009691mg [Citrus x clementina]